MDGRVLETDDNKCVTTEAETSPWWKVHLGAEYAIRHIIISTSGEYSLKDLFHNWHYKFLFLRN